MSAQKRDEKKPDEAKNIPPQEDNVDRIRDIIFGPQMRDYETRFQALEERLGNNVNTLRDEMIEGLNGIRSNLSSEVNRLSSQIQSEHSDREKGLREAASQLAEVQQSIHNQLQEQSRDTAEGLRNLEKALDKSSLDFSTTLEQQIGNLTKVLEEEVRQLRADKTDRSVLADLLTQLASQLRDESSS